MIFNCNMNEGVGLMKKFIMCVLIAISYPVFAGDDVKQEIIQRCKSQMGDYGASMVKACVDQDIEALVALNEYHEKHKSIISRCYSQMKDYGYAMIKACADQDIEAEEALSRY